MMSETERQLVKSARNGSVDSFEQLIEPYRKRIYNLMLKISDNEFEASQLAQEVFIKTFSSLLLGNLEDSLSVCIYRTADEIFRQSARKSKLIS